MRERLLDAVDWMLGVLQSLWLLLIPPRKRHALSHVESLEHLPLWSGALGLLLLICGVFLFGWGLLRFMSAFTDQAATVFWEKAQTDESVTDAEHIAYNLSGVVGWVSYFFTPVAWLAIYLLAEGLGRFILYLGPGRASGSLVAYPIAGARDLLQARWNARSRQRAFGQEVPDRLERPGHPERPWTLSVISSHDKPWRPVDTIQMDDQMYELVSVEEIREGGHLRMAYRLRPWPDNKLVRSIVSYKPPVVVQRGT